MKRFVSRLLTGSCLMATLLLSSHAYAQYGGGMGGGRMGGMGGMDMGNSGGNRRPQMPSSSDMANRQTDWMKVNLSLTKEQVKEIKKLNNVYASKQQDEIRPLLTGDGPPSEATQQQIREISMMINEEKEEKLKPLLTPEQWTRYQVKRDSLSKAAGSGRMLGPGRSN